MQKNWWDRPDSFSAAPLLSVLPAEGQVNKLFSLSASLYARYEKVTAQSDEEPGKRGRAEERMLREVLDWLQEMSEETGEQEER